MKLFQAFLEISREYWLLGETFPFLHWQDNNCAFDKIVLLNPDFVNVMANPLAYDEGIQFELEPDSALQELVKSTSERDINIRDMIDPVVSEAVQAGVNIPLDGKLISQISRKASPYDVRGTSIVVRILKDLLYEDKIRLAQMAIADRHITPLQIFRLGDPQGEYLPDQEQLDDFADLLAAGRDDPNFALVGHFGLSVEYYGSAGKVLPVVPEFEFVENRILTGLFTNKALVHGEGPCASIDSRVLTRGGWKYYDEVMADDDIATYDLETGCLEFQRPIGGVSFEYDGDMFHFDHPYLDHLVTPNHKCLINKPYKSKRNGSLVDTIWEVIRADEVSSCSRMLNSVKWEGKDFSEYINIEAEKSLRGIQAKSYSIHIDDYLELLGYVISEGNFNIDNRYSSLSQDLLDDSGRIGSIRITQKFGTSSYKKMGILMDRLPFFVSESKVGIDKYHENPSVVWRISHRSVVKHFFDQICPDYKKYEGKGLRKKIPRWVLQLPVDKLKILADALILGDGYKDPRGNMLEYYTVSEALAYDVLELFLKLGFASKVQKRVRENRFPIYRVKVISSLNNRSRNKNPILYEKHIKKVPYKGRVFCFEVPNRFYIYERNGKIAISHNTYATASIAFEALQMRYLAFRGLLEAWFREKICKPIAVAREYIDRSQADVNHNVRTTNKWRQKKDKYHLPDVKWLGKIELKDESQFRQFILQLRSRGEISLNTICDVFNLDYDQEKNMLEKEMGTISDPAWRTAVSQAMAKNFISKPQPGQVQGQAIPPQSGGVPASEVASQIPEAGLLGGGEVIPEEIAAGASKKERTVFGSDRSVRKVGNSFYVVEK